MTKSFEIIPAGSKEVFSSIDSLKYQGTAIKDGDNNELLTIKFRYKDPNENKSKLIQRTLVNSEQSKPGNDFIFASAVAEFGMILRKSKFKGNADYKDVLSLARKSKGSDENGYRAEFIRLVELAELISKSEKATSRK